MGRDYMVGRYYSSEGENRRAEIGIVIPPYAIVERIKTGSYNFFYPDFN